MKLNISLLVGLWAVVASTVLTSCNNDSHKGNVVSDLFSSELSADKIKTALDAEMSIVANDSTDIVRSEIQNLYEKNDYKPLWLDDNKLSDEAKSVIQEIGKLDLEGLDPEKYHFSKLNGLIGRKIDSEDSLAGIEMLTTRAFASAARDLTFGVLKPKEVDSEWFSDNDTAFSLANVLTYADQKQKQLLDAFRPSNPRYKMMLGAVEKWTELKSDSVYLVAKNALKSGDNSKAVTIIKKEIGDQGNDSNLIRNYQYLNHLSETGHIDEATLNVLKADPDEYVKRLKINMERMRWLPIAMSDHYVWTSIPQAEVDYYRGGENLFHSRSIVGSKTKQTPSIMKPMRNIVICPPWNLPSSIVAKDYHGRIPSKYEVYRAGKRVPNSMVNATNYKQFVVRQPAGPSAALGYVKFNLPNKWDIYLHDTPGRSLFGNKYRYMSHGCVRVKNPRALAAIILEDKGVGIDSINNLIKRNKTTTIITDQIPVYISYLTVNVDSNLRSVMYLNDPYKKDSILTQKLLLSKK